MLGKNNKIIIAVLFVMVIGLLAALFLVQDKETDELSAEVVAEKMISYINENFLDEATKASLVNVSDAGSVYKFTLSIEGSEFDSYATKDGSFLFPEGINLEEGLDLGEPQAPPSQETPELPDVDPRELASFVDCLAEEGFVIYGAEWCPHCTNLVNMFGGYEITGPIYVECPENEELCTEKGITGYPTILVNDSPYQGQRTLEGFAEATGCPAL